MIIGYPRNTKGGVYLTLRSFWGFRNRAASWGCIEETHFIEKRVFKDFFVPRGFSLDYPFVV